MIGGVRRAAASTTRKTYFSKDVMILDRKISEVENELQQEASEEMRKLTVVRRKFETEWQRVSHTTQIVLNGKAVSGASIALRVNLDLKGAENRGARVISGSFWVKGLRFGTKVLRELCLGARRTKEKGRSAG